MWRVLEQNYHNCTAFNNNYRTVLEEQVDSKWQYRAASCCSKFASR